MMHAIGGVKLLVCGVVYGGLIECVRYYYRVRGHEPGHEREAAREPVRRSENNDDGHAMKTIVILPQGLSQ